MSVKGMSARESTQQFLFKSYGLQREHYQANTKEVFSRRGLSESEMQRFLATCRVNEVYVKSDHAMLVTRAKRIDALAKIFLESIPRPSDSPPPLSRGTEHSSAFKPYVPPITITAASDSDQEAASSASGNEADDDRSVGRSPSMSLSDTGGASFERPTVGATPSGDDSASEGPSVEERMHTVHLRDPQEPPPNYKLWLYVAVAATALAIGVNYVAPGLNGRVQRLIRSQLNIFS